MLTLMAVFSTAYATSTLRLACGASAPTTKCDELLTHHTSDCELLIRSDGDEGHVIAEVPGCEYSQLVDDPLLQVHCAEVPRLDHESDQAIFTEFVLAAASLRCAVGEEDDPITRSERRRLLFVGRVAKEAADGRSAARQTVHLATRAHEDRRVVTGIAVSECAGDGIEDTVEERDELAAGEIASDDRLHALADVRRRSVVRRAGFHRRLQIRHQQRGGHSFPRHVGDADPSAAVTH